MALFDIRNMMCCRNLSIAKDLQNPSQFFCEYVSWGQQLIALLWSFVTTLLRGRQVLGELSSISVRETDAAMHTSGSTVASKEGPGCSERKYYHETTRQRATGTGIPTKYADSWFYFVCHCSDTNRCAHRPKKLTKCSPTFKVPALQTRNVLKN